MVEGLEVGFVILEIVNVICVEIGTAPITSPDILTKLPRATVQVGVAEIIPDTAVAPQVIPPTGMTYCLGK